MNCIFRGVIIELKGIDLFDSGNIAEFLSKWVVLIYALAGSGPVYHTLLSIEVYIFNIFYLLIGIMLVHISLVTLTFLRFKVFPYACLLSVPCPIVNCMSVLPPIIIGRVTIALLPLIKKKNI